MSTSKMESLGQISPEPERVDDITKAWDAALAEKPARDFGRESGIKPEEKEMFDQIAERRGNSKLKELEGMDIKKDKLQGERSHQEELLTDLENSLITIRKELGIEKSEGEEDPSVIRSEERLRQLVLEHGDLANNRKAFLKEFEVQIKYEIRIQILQEGTDKIFTAFESIPREEVDVLRETGKARDGEPLRIEGFGTLEPETVICMAEAFTLGLRYIPDIVERIPDFSERLGGHFKEEVNQEASGSFSKLLTEGSSKDELEQKDEGRMGLEESYDAAYAEKPLRDLAREPDINPEEKEKIDSIAERRSDEDLVTPQATESTPETAQSRLSEGSVPSMMDNLRDQGIDFETLPFKDEGKKETMRQEFGNIDRAQQEASKEDSPGSLSNLERANEIKRDQLRKEGFDA
jgi:hypothetical protein